MKKTIIALATTVLMSTAALADGHEKSVGVSANVGLLSGAGVEVTYPINDIFHVRGSLSAGLGIDETSGDPGEVQYNGQADGGINRLAIDYRPWAGTFFISAGYAMNNFALDVTGTGSGTTTVGDDQISGNININGQLNWDNGATLSMGWGHSPEQGWGAMLEIGAIFTGAANVSLTGTTDAADPAQSELDAALAKEEDNLRSDMADLDFLPIIQAGITYRF